MRDGEDGDCFQSIEWLDRPVWGVLQGRYLYGEDLTPETLSNPKAIIFYGGPATTKGELCDKLTKAINRPTAARIAELESLRAPGASGACRPTSVFPRLIRLLEAWLIFTALVVLFTLYLVTCHGGPQ